MRTQQNVLNAVTGTTVPQSTASNVTPPVAPGSPPPPPTAVPSSNWYLARGGATHGPYPEETLRSYIASGNVGATDQLCQEGTSNWVPAQSVPQFGALFNVGGPPPPPPTS